MLQWMVPHSSVSEAQTGLTGLSETKRTRNWKGKEDGARPQKREQRKP